MKHLYFYLLNLTTLASAHSPHPGRSTVILRVHQKWGLEEAPCDHRAGICEGVLEGPFIGRQKESFFWSYIPAAHQRSM